MWIGECTIMHPSAALIPPVGSIPAHRRWYNSITFPCVRAWTRFVGPVSVRQSAFQAVPVHVHATVPYRTALSKAVAAGPLMMDTLTLLGFLGKSAALPWHEVDIPAVSDPMNMHSNLENHDFQQK